MSESQVNKTEAAPEDAGSSAERTSEAPEGDRVAYEPSSDKKTDSSDDLSNDLEQSVPLGAVRRVVKLENATASAEALFVLARGAELFLNDFVSETIEEAANKPKASSLVCYADVAGVVKTNYPFLSDMIPVVSANSKFSKSKAKKRKRV